MRHRPIKLGDFGIRKSLLIHIFGGANRRFAGHDLADKFLLALHKLVKVGIEGALGDIAVNVYRRIFVALPDNAPLPLLRSDGRHGQSRWCKAASFC